ncbi:hypothetical protein IAQ61_000518 [Plenodomus lingam]|uniref:uncharacterized protein n=1 Tax=Leptosphaeria maculans TaxID=5022 RepID=UPI0033184247|nr:hypothetical protein IAQ61_000518 [Plenodomus lingam]
MCPCLLREQTEYCGLSTHPSIYYLLLPACVHQASSTINRVPDTNDDAGSRGKEGDLQGFAASSTSLAIHIHAAPTTPWERCRNIHRPAPTARVAALCQLLAARVLFLTRPALLIPTCLTYPYPPVPDGLGGPHRETAFGQVCPSSLQPSACWQ